MTSLPIEFNDAARSAVPRTDPAKADLSLRVLQRDEFGDLRYPTDELWEAIAPPLPD